MKRLDLLLPLLAFAAAGCFQEETIFVPFVDPATNAPALMPEPLSALRLGMTESELRAVRPDARPGNDELVPGFFEELREGAFQHAVYLVEDAPGGGNRLRTRRFCDKIVLENRRKRWQRKSF